MLRIIAGSIFTFVVAYVLVLIFRRYILRSTGTKKWPAVLGGTIAVLLHLVFLPVSSNDAIATINASDSSYLLTLTGQRLQEDGLFSGIYPCLRKDTFRINVPRRKGIVNIKNHPGQYNTYNVFGRIVFSDDSAEVELYYDNKVARTTDLLDWNGKYLLK